MSNMWNTESEPSEYEQIEESIEDALEEAPVPHDVYDFSEIDESIIEEIQEESAFDLEDDDVSSVYNVRVRLEQARLYDMLINHNLFEGVDASSQAINNVQKELKEYIVSRLELLMGIRQPKSEVREEIIIDQPFNDVKIDFLKQLSFKGTQGRSSDGEYSQPEITRVKQTLKPLTAPKQQGLKPMSKPVVKEEVIEDKPLRKTAKKPAKRVAKKPVKKQTAKEKKESADMKKIGKKIKGSLQEQAMQDIARDKAIKKSRGGKKWENMSAKERAAEVRRTNTRNAKAPIKTQPSFTQEQINAKYQQQDMIRSGKTSGVSGFNTMLATQIANSKS